MKSLVLENFNFITKLKIIGNDFFMFMIFILGQSLRKRFGFDFKVLFTCLKSEK